MFMQMPQSSQSSQSLQKAPSERLKSRSAVLRIDQARVQEAFGGAASLSISVADVLLAASAMLFYRYEERQDAMRLACRRDADSEWQEYDVDLSDNPQVRETVQGVVKHAALMQTVRLLRAEGAFELEVSWARQEQQEQQEQGLTSAGEWEVVISYLAERYQAATVERMLGHLQMLLTGMIETPEKTVCALPMLTAAEQQEMLVTHNATARPFPHDATLPELFAAQVARTPEHVAVAFAGTELTYGELDARSNQLAHVLQARGIGHGVVTGLCVERSLEMVVGLLAILKAGGIVLPLDVQAPKERLQMILEDTQAPLILTQARWVREGLVEAARSLSLDEEAVALAAEQPHTPPTIRTVAQDTAYLIFTSGSTGTPKGVCVPHRGIARLIIGSEYATFSEAEVMLQFAPIAFDASFFEFFGSLLFGATLHIYPPGVPALHELASFIKEHRVSTLFLTTGLLHQMIEHHLEDLQGVTQLFTGGDVLSPVHYQKLLDERPSLHFVNLYGPTECSMVATSYEDFQPMAPGQFVPIGKPIANTTVYVLNRDGQFVPAGVPGELYIGGEGVANGYWNRAELTAERFLPDPFANNPMAPTMYRTGDLVCWNADGHLQFLGRADRQVKIRGFRLELGEIEAHLIQLEAVREAAVLVHADEKGGKQLVAYVVPEPGCAPSAAEMREALGRVLPGYMVPAVYVSLEQFPLTTNGKLDRKALPVPQPDAFVSEADFVEPRNEVEAQVAEFCARAMGLKRLSVLDNMLDLGAHSLIATQIVSQIRQHFGVELSLRQFMEHPTAADLADLIAGGELVPSQAVSPLQKATDRPARVPLSSAQHRMWLLDQLDPGNPAYNIAAAWRFSGAVNEEALKRGLLHCIQQHEILRTVFGATDGVPWQEVQEVREDASLDWAVVEVTEVMDNATHWQQAMQSEAARPFDLAEGPLMRARLYRLGSQDHVCLLAMHHIVTDGWSMNVLMREWEIGYAAAVGENVSAVNKPELHYADYAIWEQEQTSRIVDEHLTYWKEKLTGQSPLVALPYDRPRPVVPTSNGRKLTVDIPADVTSVLKKVSREQGGTLYMTLLTAFLMQLHRYGRQDDISVGTLLANRQPVETEAMIGFFVNTLVLRNDLSGNPTFRELLSRVRRTTMEAYEHQAMPFEKLVEAINPDRQGFGNPLFHVLFVFHNEKTAMPHLPGLTAESLRVDLGTSRFDLALDVEENGAGLTAVFEYNTDLFEEATMQRMMGHYRTLLESIAEAPDAQLAEIPVLPAAERDLLVREWNQTDAVYDQDLCVHQAFERQAKETPDATAMVFEETEWTYEQLDRRTNRVARLLQQHGVAPDMRVGIRMERSLDMIAGLLGILKAGGAYVPMDPSYPQDRLLHMLEDSQMQVLVTQRSLVDDLPELPATSKVICLDEVDFDAMDLSDEPVGTAVTPANLAYMIYTSGSTGKPKGVMVEHRNVLNFFAGMNDKLPCTEQDTLLAVTSISFDISVLELFWTLSRGVKVVLISEEAQLQENGLGEQAQRHGATMLQCTPSLMRLLLQNPQSRQQFQTLRTVMLGGEALPLALAEEVKNTWPVRLFNMYGPTETTIWSTVQEVQETAASMPIGRPIANTTVYVLDEHLQLVPIGAVGELYIGGAGVTRGYWQRPDLTEDRFIADPFSTSAQEGSRLYRTGDLVRYQADGTLAYLGRNDHQVKFRGYRIELGEIETVLESHPLVQKAVVTAQSDAQNEMRLVGYVVYAGDKQTMDQELRARLKESVPDWFMPSLFVALDELPLTPNGKVDRKALPQPNWNAMKEERAYVAPRTATEEQLAQVWADVFGLEQVGIYDDFFQLGGHSLLATKLVARIRTAFQIDLPMRKLFQASTVAALSELIVAEQLNSVDEELLLALLAEMEGQ